MEWSEVSVEGVGISCAGSDAEVSKEWTVERQGSMCKQSKHGNQTDLADMANMANMANNWNTSGPTLNISFPLQGTGQSIIFDMS